MTYFKLTSFLTLSSLLIASIESGNAVATSLQCNTLFGRTIYAGVTNYSFSCKCIASNYYTSIQNECVYSGTTPKSECASTSENISPNGEISLKVVNCTSDKVFADIRAKDEFKKVSFPLQCNSVGVSALECKGSTTVL